MKFLRKTYNSMFTESGLLLVPIFIIIFILSSSVTDIMTRLGFTTKESLQNELNLTKQKLAISEAEVKRLTKVNELESKKCDIEREVINDLDVKNTTIDQLINNIIISDPVEEVIDDPPIVEEIETPIVEKVDTISSRNIGKINLAYNSMFGVWSC